MNILSTTDPRSIRSRVVADDSCIIIVDDSRIIRKIVEKSLRDEGFSNLHVAENGLEALNLMERCDPDLIILDLEMPVMNGFDACLSIRSRSNGGAVPILIQTATQDMDVVRRVLDIGANDVMMKPFKHFELVSRVRVQLENRKLVQSLVSFRNRITSELASARSMQRFLCPAPRDRAEMAKRHGLDIGSIYVPSSEIGGDIWGFVEIDDTLNFYLADFAGHGVPAALNTFRLHTLVSSLSAEGLWPAQILCKLNAQLVNVLEPGQYAVMLWGRYDKTVRTLTYATAGALPPLICGADGKYMVADAEARGLPLGFVRDVEYQEHTLEVKNGFRFIAASDGLFEARNAQREFLDEDGLLNIVNNCRNNFDMQGLMETVFQQVVKFQNFKVIDDLTAVAIAYDDAQVADASGSTAGEA